ncbi:MAG: gamma-glutamyltransferase [Burkholderiales bacterium]|nr:gamma-glutamyltransferase [Burkholderiales bacterium]
MPVFRGLYRRALQPVLWVFIAVFVGAAPALAERYAVASAHPLATKAGERILASGGSAFDAAVTVAATLAVVEPFASGLGGGGFFLLHRGSDGFEVVVDVRETAPLAASRDMYLNDRGEPDARASLDGGKAAGIPGTPAGLAHIAQRYGRLPLARLLAPAIELAEQGFVVDGRYIAAASWRASVLKADPAAAAVFLDQGVAPSPGYVVKQPGLAQTLRAIAGQGADGFYRGPVAEEMVRAVRAAGGIWSLEDLARYRLMERDPLKFRYRDATVTTIPLPSSGGLVLAQALQILERFELADLPAAERDHLIVESLRRGFHDRARYMGDADFVTVPEARLRSREYAMERAASIDPARATPSSELGAQSAAAGGTNTTHFSVVDADGNRVAATLSVNGPFGAATVAGASGVLLNNTMNDFALSPESSNLYGLSGSQANLIAPGKRPLSSMSPAFVEDKRGVLVLGTPGGSRIISMVLLGILTHLNGGPADPERVVGIPRFHHQYLPDRIEIEPMQFGPEWRQALEGKGHVVQEGKRRWGNMQAVFVDGATREATAASDPRGKSGVLF